MTQMESPPRGPRGAAAWSVLFATVSILAFAVPAHAQVTPLVVDFDKTDYRVVEGESLAVRVTLTPAADREVEIPIEVTGYTAVGYGAEDGDYTVRGLTSGNLTFADGDESKFFVVTANEDTETRHFVDDVELDFGTLPSGVTSSRSSQSYRAVVRILDDDFSKTVSAREDQPSDWRFGTLAAPEDPEMDTLKWWLGGSEAQYFELGTPIIQPPWVFARFYVRSDTMLDRDVEDSYEFFVYYSDGSEPSGADPGCSETTPSNCRPDYRATIKVNITDKPEITLNQSSVPEETASNSVDVSFLGFQVSDQVTLRRVR